jgi:chemotaxis methyl-accepting protein methylase
MEFDEFLREATALLGLQWRPFHRKGIKRKVERRVADVGLSDFEEYLLKAKKDSEEQRVLSKILTVTISRFFRDKGIFDTLGQHVFPDLLKQDRNELKIWSIGCASGEEPYSLSMLWKEKFEKIWPQIRVSILATDVDEAMLERAREGKYKNSSLKEIPVFDQTIRQTIEFKKHDILHEEPFLGMNLVLCRNLAFTYFSKGSQIEALRKIALSLKEGGYLVIGKDESLPLTYPTLFVAVFPNEKIYEKFS